jgi:hypothetical protein
MFVFQDNFWLNLHQFLRGEVYRRNVKAAPGLDEGLLSGTDLGVWTRSLDAYADLARRDVLFDDLLRRIGNALATAGDVQAIPEGLDRTIGANTRIALNAAAPIYRARVWPARQRENQAWIASARALLAQHETPMASKLARLYGVGWPRAPILVDVVGEVGPNSAITHGGPPGFAAHTQASAGSRRNTGDAPLELLLHEAAHAEPVEAHIQRMIEEECARQKLPAPENLWHALIMYTSGAVAREELAKSGGRDYIPYADRYHQYTSAEQSALERDWQPYVDGKASREQTLHDLVRDAR